MRLSMRLIPFLIAVVAMPFARASDGRPDGFHPARGAVGDLVYVQGKGIGADSEILLGEKRAPIVRAGMDALVCRVPEGVAAGRVRVTVDEHALPDPFLAMARGRPVVHGASADVATPGQTLLLFGRRLGGGKVALLDEQGAPVARVPAVGGRRVVAVQLPVAISPGWYHLRLTNHAGLSTQDDAHELEIRAPGLRHFRAVQDGPACPGRRIVCRGAELATLGSCELRWAAGDGRVTSATGWSNGHDLITTVVPRVLPADRWYGLRLAPPGGEADTLGRVFVEAPDLPERLELAATDGVEGGVAELRGAGFSGLGAVPQVILGREQRRILSRTLYRHPGGLGHGRAWLVRLPDALDAGDYRVTVRLRDILVDAGSLRVKGARRSTADESR